MWTLTTTQGGGMVYYALSMLREFSRLIPENLVVFYGAHGRELVSSVREASGIRRIELRNPEELYANQSLFDIVFCPSVWGWANMLDRPIVHVIPDIQEKYYPEFFSPEEVELRDTLAGHSARASTILITVSNFSKGTIVEAFGVPEEKVRVSYQAAHPIFSDDGHSGIRPSKLPDGLEGFLVYPANSWGHKNHKGLLDGLVELRKRYGIEMPCVLTGHLLKGQHYEVDILREISSRELERQVFHLGTVTLQELKYLYMHAAALIHPSLFEGFGIPLVEAMSCGCPIVAANVTSIPEIAGAAALYFDPTDPVEMADKIHHLLDRPDDARKRVTVGRSLSRSFSDSGTAQETLNILEDAYRISGIGSLKAKAARAWTGHRTLLSLLLVFQESPDKEMVSEIERLFVEFPDSVQVIAVAPEALRDSLTESFEGKATISPLGGSIREAVSKASPELKGEYVFLSDGKSVILPSFLYYLMAYEAGFLGKGEFLEGDWYVRSPGGKGLGDSPILQARDEQKRRLLVCRNLSFIVRRDAFRQVVEWQSAGPDTIMAIATSLWDNCSRTRIFRTVDLRLANDETGETSNISLVTRKLKVRLGTKPWLRLMLRTKMGYGLLTVLVKAYYVIPPSLQRTMLTAYKTIGGN